MFSTREIKTVHLKKRKKTKRGRGHKMMSSQTA